MSDLAFGPILVSPFSRTFANIFETYVPPSLAKIDFTLVLPGRTTDDNKMDSLERALAMNKCEPTRTKQNRKTTEEHRSRVGK